MHETIKFYGTVRFSLLDKLELKMQNVLMSFNVDFAVFFSTPEALLQYDTVVIKRDFEHSKKNLCNKTFCVISQFSHGQPN